VTGTFTVYDLVLILLFFGGLAERIFTIHKIRLRLHWLERKHPTDGPHHQAVYSPGQDPEQNP
jgi:hypothetical protein